MSIQLVPQNPIPERAIETALKNIVAGISELLQEETATLVNEWAEASGIENPNIFMRDKVAALLSAVIAGYVEKVQPSATQWTPDHVEAYYQLPLLPPGNLPDPVAK